MSASRPISLSVTYSRPCSLGPHRVGVRVPHDHAHPEALEDLRSDLADLAGPDQAGGLAVHVEADQTVEGEVHVTHAPVRLRDPPVEGHRERHGVLGHGIGRVGRHAGHDDPVLLGGLEVNTVEAGAAQGDHAHALLGEDPDDLPVQSVVDEDTDDIGVLTDGLHGLRVQPVLAELDVQPGGDHGLSEVLAVVLLRVEHSDVCHGRTVPTRLAVLPSQWRPGSHRWPAVWHIAGMRAPVPVARPARGASLMLERCSPCPVPASPGARTR